jgi:hypothetical protein
MSSSVEDGAAWLHAAIRSPATAVAGMARLAQLLRTGPQAKSGKVKKGVGAGSAKSPRKRAKTAAQDSDEDSASDEDEDEDDEQEEMEVDGASSSGNTIQHCIEPCLRVC